MRALIQRVSRASVWVGNDGTGSIDEGLVVFLGVSRDDTEADASYLVERILGLRIFADQSNRFNLSALDVSADLMVISQFTLYADTRRGRRPDFTLAASPADAIELYEHVLGLFRQSGLRLVTGAFGQYMRVDLVNEGPVTIMLDSVDRLRPRRG